MANKQLTPEQAAAAVRNREMLRQRALLMARSMSISKVRLAQATLRWLDSAHLAAFSFINIVEYEQ